MTIEDILKARKFDPNKQPEPEQIILKIGGKKVGSLQNLVTFTGKQKNGKTRFISATIAAALTGNEIFEIRLRLPQQRNKIILFDTEQGDYDFYKTIRQIQDFTQLTALPVNFEAYNTREDDPITTLKMIYQVLDKNPDCSLLIIDGILDLLIDFNNVAESKRISNFLKQITKRFNCLVLGVIHRGKGSDTTIGNIGSMADRLAQSVLKIEKNKDKGTFVLSSEFMRSDEDFTPVEIWKVGNNWEQTFYQPQEPEQSHKTKAKATPEDYDHQYHFLKVTEIFNDGILLTYEQTVQAIKEIYATGRNWAVECLKHLKSLDLVFRTSDGYTNIKQTKIKHEK